MRFMRGISRLGLCALMCALVAGGAAQQNADSLAGRIAKIMARPEFKYTSFGIEFYSLDTGKPVYRLDAGKLFTPGSTTKLLTEGTALALLGADYRFHTKVYRTGPIDANGTLKGDLILVASGDPNLSGRIQPDGTMGYTNEDHSYAGSPDTKAVPGDPLLVIRELAAQVAAHGVKRVEGHVIVDATLFREGARELGTGAVISPMVVNDNCVDLNVAPGAAVGDPVAITVSPQSSYVRFLVRMTTGEKDSLPMMRYNSDEVDADGKHTVILSGSRAGRRAALFFGRIRFPSQADLRKLFSRKRCARRASPRSFEWRQRNRISRRWRRRIRMTQLRRSTCRRRWRKK